jgi:nucleotide-binding universal stress UspA family protein
MDAHRPETATDGPSLILAAVDGTDTSMRAAAYAIGMARRDGAELMCLFVRDPSAIGTTSAMAIAAQRESDATALDLTAAAAERAAALGVPITVLDLEGDPYQHIIQAAREYKADLVVLGASTSLAHRLAGSLGVRLVKARLGPVGCC